MHLLEAAEILKEPLDTSHKKMKLDEYTAYLYAMDPLYLHAALYNVEQWSHRQLSAFRPVSNNIYSKENKSNRHSHHSIKYKDPPILQNPERVIPMSESERFERSFQPNVALAPPKKHKYKEEIKQEEEFINNKEIIDVSSRPENVTTVITKDCSQRNNNNEIERTHSAIVDSTVSVVQSTGTQRYNSEIELSTDTDDSLSDTSDNNRKVSTEISR